MAIIRRESTMPARGFLPGRDWDPFRTMRALLSWDPFQEMMPRLWRDEEQMLYAPAFDVKETKDAYEFTADLPGFREQDVDINLSGNRLTISGKREAEQTEESETYFCAERSYGAFTRTFTLPDGADTERAEAELRDGVLTVRVPKAAEAQAKRIPVKAAAGAIGAGGGKAQAQQASEPKAKAQAQPQPQK